MTASINNFLVYVWMGLVSSFCLLHLCEM